MRRTQLQLSAVRCRNGHFPWRHRPFALLRGPKVILYSVRARTGIEVNQPAQGEALVMSRDTARRLLGVLVGSAECALAAIPRFR
jgi:hypothetical protein